MNVNPVTLFAFIVDSKPCLIPQKWKTSRRAYITFMNRKLQMKFYVKEKKRHEHFSGQIVSYDGLSGMYGAYYWLD